MPAETLNPANECGRLSDGGHCSLQLLATYCDRELKPAQATAVRAHLADCDVCRDNMITLLSFPNFDASWSAFAEDNSELIPFEEAEP